MKFITTSSLDRSIHSIENYEIHYVLGTCWFEVIRGMPSNRVRIDYETENAVIRIYVDETEAANIACNYNRTIAQMHSTPFNQRPKVDKHSFFGVEFTFLEFYKIAVADILNKKKLFLHDDPSVKIDLHYCTFENCFFAPGQLYEGEIICNNNYRLLIKRGISYFYYKNETRPFLECSKHGIFVYSLGYVAYNFKMPLHIENKPYGLTIL